jgi:hypothetical protein
MRDALNHAQSTGRSKASGATLASLPPPVNTGAASKRRNKGDVRGQRMRYWLRHGSRRRAYWRTYRAQRRASLRFYAAGMSSVAGQV